MLFFNKRKEQVIPIEFSYVDFGELRNYGRGNLCFSKNQKLIDYLRENKRIEIKDVTFENGRTVDVFDISQDHLIYIGLNKVPEPKYNKDLYHSIELMIGGYGGGFPNHEKIKGKVALFDKDYLKRVKHGPFIVIKDFERTKKVKKYPAAVLFWAYTWLLSSNLFNFPNNFLTSMP